MLIMPASIDDWWPLLIKLNTHCITSSSQDNSGMTLQVYLWKAFNCTEITKSLDYPQDDSTINDSNFDHFTKITLKKLDKNKRDLTSWKQHIPLRGFCSFLDRRIHNKTSNPRSNRKATPPKIPPMRAPFPLDFSVPNHEL